MNTISYRQIEFWNNSFPLLLSPKSRITKEVTLNEYFWHWGGHEIHIDHYCNDAAKAKIILLHGLGMNGRLNSFLAVPLWKLGYDVVSPDLPLFGLTKGNNKDILYDDWILLVKDLIEHERAVDGKPIYLFGLSTSGVLAYQAASLAKINGLIVTHLLDQRKFSVRIDAAKNKVAGLISLPFCSILSPFEPDVYLPLNTVINPKAMITNEVLYFSLLNDKYSFCTDVSLRFLNSILKSKLYIEPENFTNCPLLLLHPELDKWVRIENSTSFYDKLKCDKSLEIINGAGHMPFEEFAINLIEKALENYIDKTINLVTIYE